MINIHVRSCTHQGESDTVAGSVACPLCKRAAPGSSLASGTFFHGKKVFPSSADSISASCQLLAKEWALKTGKLPPEGLPRMVK